MTIHSVLIQKLLSTNAHIGRRYVAQHLKLYTHGTRNNISIFDADKTLICLRSACNFIGSLVRLNGRFLFVNTNPLHDEIVEEMTTKIGVKMNNALWRMGGFLTNSNSPKKFRSRNKKLCFAPAQLPDCLVIMDTERKSSVINEAAKLQIPIVALVDSSMPPDLFRKISYPVPGNDSVQFVYLFCNLITKTILLEQRKMGIFRDDASTIMSREAVETGNEDVIQQIAGSSDSTLDYNADSHNGNFLFTCSIDLVKIYFSKRWFFGTNDLLICNAYILYDLW
nr:ribosomal protein S2 [Sedum plumbizincicola]